MANVKQNGTKEMMVRSTYFQNLKCNVKKTCIFHLIVVGIPSGLTSSVRNSGWGINSMDKIHKAGQKLSLSMVPNTQYIHPIESDTIYSI